MGDVATVDMDLVVRWIEALESGEYKQAKGKLRRDDAMCCLGVVCHVADPNRWHINSYGDFVWGDPGATIILPVELRARLGIGEGGERKDGGVWILSDLEPDPVLSNINDRGATFAEIAAALRQYYALPPRDSEQAAPR